MITNVMGYANQIKVFKLGVLLKVHLLNCNDKRSQIEETVFLLTFI